MLSKPSKLRHSQRGKEMEIENETYFYTEYRDTNERKERKVSSLFSIIWCKYVVCTRHTHTHTELKVVKKQKLNA